MGQTEDLQKVLLETSTFLQEIAVVEEEKFQAAIKNHILVIEECIKKEQAFVLRSKGLEQKRRQIQKAMNAEDMTLKQIIENAAPEEKEALQAAYLELQKNIEIYQEIHGRAKTAIEVNLHKINAEIEHLTGSASGENASYSNHGEKKENPKTFTSRKI